MELAHPPAGHWRTGSSSAVWSASQGDEQGQRKQQQRRRPVSPALAPRRGADGGARTHSAPDQTANRGPQRARPSTPPPRRSQTPDSTHERSLPTHASPAQHGRANVRRAYYELREAGPSRREQVRSMLSTHHAQIRPSQAPSALPEPQTPSAHEVALRVQRLENDTTMLLESLSAKRSALEDSVAAFGAEGMQNALRPMYEALSLVMGASNEEPRGVQIEPRSPLSPQRQRSAQPEHQQLPQLKSKSERVEAGPEPEPQQHSSTRPRTPPPPELLIPTLELETVDPDQENEDVQAAAKPMDKVQTEPAAATMPQSPPLTPRSPTTTRGTAGSTSPPPFSKQSATVVPSPYNIYAISVCRICM